MIETEKRNAIFLLHKEGMSARQISSQLNVSRNAVRRVIREEGAVPNMIRKDKQILSEELLRSLYKECDGYVKRVHEKLVEEKNVKVEYSTLTRMIRDLGISKPQKVRCDRVPDEPGQEMQHDTTVYWLKLGPDEQKTKVVASLLYLRYSKLRYLKFYRTFNRFDMKCFIHEALMCWGYSAPQCIIDNTNLARLAGTGKNAIINPEMVAFSKAYGFEFICHALNHPNRKAGEERSFYTVETNFIPGREYTGFPNLNEQAFDWSTVRMTNRPQGKANLIPAKAFELEQTFLTKLSAHLPAPYKEHERVTDEYGYIAFNGNYYWVPGTKREIVKVLQYSAAIKLFLKRECIAEYPLPAYDVKNERFSPKGLPLPRFQPNHRKGASEEEEKQLRAISDSIGLYIDFIRDTKGLKPNDFIRKLLILSRRMSHDLFRKSVERAHKYRIITIDTIERIARFYATEGVLPFVEVDKDLLNREAFREGSFTDMPDLSVYSCENLFRDEEVNKEITKEEVQEEIKENDLEKNENEKKDGKKNDKE